jgi:hypothetical protein
LIRYVIERFNKENEDRELAMQLQQQAALQPGPPSTSSGKVEGVKAPDRWNPKEMSWQEFAVTLVFYFLNCVTDQRLWGIRALTFLPRTAQQSFVAWIKLPVTALDASIVTWAKVTHSCAYFFRTSQLTPEPCVKHLAT